MKPLFLISSLLLIASSVWAQTPKNAPQVSHKAQQDRRVETRAGNKAYEHKKYDEATKHYNQALKSDSNYYKAQFNLGNAMYRQGNYDRATECYTHALQQPNLAPKEQSRIHYNLGNSHLQSGLGKKKNVDPANPQSDNGMQDFQQAVTHYQEALKVDPKNQDAKYNLSYAMKMLQQAQQQQQQNGGGGGGQNDKNKDQNQQGQGNQQQNQDKNQGKGNDPSNANQQNNPDNNGNGDKNDKSKDQNKSKDPAKDQRKKEAEQLLNAVKNNEKQTMKDQMKVKEAKVDGRIEKDW